MRRSRVPLAFEDLFQVSDTLGLGFLKGLGKECGKQLQVRCGVGADPHTSWGPKHRIYIVWGGAL